MPHLAHKDLGRIDFAFVFACAVCKNLKAPNLSPHSYDAITLGVIGGLGSIVCDVHSENKSKLWMNF